MLRANFSAEIIIFTIPHVLSSGLYEEAEKHTGEGYKGATVLIVFDFAPKLGHPPKKYILITFVITEQTRFKFYHAELSSVSNICSKTYHGNILSELHEQI